MGIHSWALHRESGEAALFRVEQYLGTAGAQTSPLLRYRWSSDFQRDWKEEIGHWLHTAEEHGYLRPLVARTLAERKGSRQPDVHPNDLPHLKLRHNLAPAKVGHYLLRTGWGFVGWEPVTGGSVDVDLRLRAPNGGEVNFQVKAPDQPGVVINHRLIDGEFDERIVRALDKAAAQLPHDDERVNLIAVTALRRWPLSIHCRCAVVHLVGSTVSDGTRTSLWRSMTGTFFSEAWRHVGGVVILDYVRTDTFEYSCTVIANPNAHQPLAPDWFPHARVCVLDGSKFRWIRGTPAHDCTLLDGTPFDRDR